MASLNASDAKNMPVALESLDACAPNNQRNQESTMATEEEDSEKGSAEDEEHEQSPIDALIDPESNSASGNRNIVPTEHRTNIEQIKPMKNLIANDEISDDSMHRRQQTQTNQFDETKCNESDDSKVSSPNDHVIINQNENTGDGNTDDINELDNIFGLDSHNGLTSPSKDKSLELEKSMDDVGAGPECHRLNPTESSNDIQNDLMADDREENSSLRNVFVPNSCINSRQNDANLDARVFNDVNQTGHQSQLQHDTSTMHSNAEQMHQYEQRMYQYNQQMNIPHELNLSSHHLSQQQPQPQPQQQQHQMDMQIHRDNDTHYQYKMYSHPSMYMPPVNGYGNSFSNSSQHQQAQIQQTASFKPYQLDSPATPSAKHSNISSAPGTPSSLDQRTPQQQQQQQDDPYNFVDDDMHSLPAHGNHLAGIGSFGLQQMRTNFNMNNESMSTMKNTMLPSLHKSMDTQNSPKKRGRKKKVRNDDGQIIPLGLANETGVTVKPPATKERKKHDRFNGMSEEEVSKRTLPDHLSNNLDIIIIGINPGLFAAYRGHHYAGPGNHFWKCLYLSGLTHEQMNAEEDFKLLDYGIGFTNMVQRATKGSADLTRKEIKEGSRLLHEKLRRYRPKIAVFNGKLIFEVFSGKKDFNFGRQPECVEGTNTYMWVMPSSSARCAQLPRAADKVPFYAALKKFRDYLNGIIPHIDESECVFADPKSKVCYENDSSKDTLSVSRFPQNSNSGMGMLGGPMSDIMHHHPSDMTDINDMTDMRMMDVPTKKKRGRPKKVRGEGEENIKITVPRRPQNRTQETELLGDDVVPKKKRGRPKKVKADNIDGMMINTKIPANSVNIEKIINETALDSERPIFSAAMNKSMASQEDHQLSQAQVQSHKQQSIQTQKQQNQSSMNLFSQMSNNNSPLNNNNSNGNIQCAMNGGFNQNMQQSSFQSHEHSSQHHNQSTTASASPQQFSHSDLSSDISAAISTSEHIQPHSTSAIGSAGNGDTNSPSSNSQSIAATDFETPDCVHNDNWNDHSPFSVSQQPSNTPLHWQQKSTSMGVNAPNSQYLSVDSQKSSSVDPQKSSFVSIDAPHSHLNAHQMHLQHHHQQLHLQQHVQNQLGSFQSPHHLPTHHADEMNAYLAKQAAQSQQQPQNSSQQQQAQQQTAITDVTAKSLSGLESLVDQIPSLSDNHDSTGPPSVHILSSLRSSENRLNDITSMVGGAEHHQATPFQNSCLYSTNYLSNTSSNLGSSILSSSSASNELQRCNSNRSRSSDINGSSTPTNLMSHYPGSNYSSSSSSVIMPSVSGLHSPNSPHTQTQTSPMNPLNNHPFSVSNLTGNHTNYSLTPPPSTPSASMPMNSYHSNFMAAAMQPPLYIHDFYDKTHPPIPPDFFQKTARQPTSNVDPHFQSFYHSHAAAAAAAGLSSYGQHSGFSTASYGFSANEFFDKTPAVQSQTQSFSASNPPMPIMPSPNYPYGYSEHHRRQNYIASDLTFFPNHGMFDHR